MWFMPKKLKKLAEEVENPVSDFVRFGFVNNTLFGTGLNNHLSNVFNLEAAHTGRFGGWALLNRLTIPIPYFPANAIEDKTGSMTGLGDTEYMEFFVRDESKRRFKLIGGIGPLGQEVIPAGIQCRDLRGDFPIGFAAIRPPIQNNAMPAFVYRRGRPNGKNRECHFAVPKISIMFLDAKETIHDYGRAILTGPSSFSHDGLCVDSTGKHCRQIGISR